MDDTLSFIDLINQVTGLIFSVGLFFVFGRLAPNVKVLALLYSIPILIFIYDMRNPHFNLPPNFYFGFSIALFVTCLFLFYGEAGINENGISRNSLLEEAAVRYKSLHQHCKKVFWF